MDITKLINQHGKGALLAEINDSLTKLVKDCCDTRKKGALTIKFTIDPIPMRDGGFQARVTPNVGTANPKYDSGVGIFFVVTDDKDQVVDLEQDDPRQIEMFNQLTKEVQG